jgi:Zn ribbon nucleic-acid-binding protein
MDYGDCIKELKNGGKMACPSVAKGHWIELRNGKIRVVGKLGHFVPWKPTDDDQLRDDWEPVLDEKIIKVEYTKKVIFEAECPSCLTQNSIKKEDIESKDDKVLDCVKCGYPFGIKKSSDSGGVI